MKPILKPFFLLLLVSDLSFASTKLSCSSALTRTRSSPFEILENKYVAIPLEFSPTEQLRSDLEGVLKSKLLNRGESHITILSTPEFSVLSKKLSAAEIKAILDSFAKVKNEIEPVCIGKGEALIDGRTEQTYFVVVKAPLLLKIRQAIQQAFVKKGGPENAFRADIYHPHITLGFTKRDLYDTDGVVKSSSACIVEL